LIETSSACAALAIAADPALSAVEEPKNQAFLL
jgi:hypothetical protein